MKEETIWDIIKGMRGFRRYADSESNDCRYVAYWMYETIPDRLEAALKQERARIGDNAKMRKALLNCRTRLVSVAMQHTEWKNCVDNDLLEIDSALAAPQRNCDVGTVADQVRRYQAFCKRHRGCDDCHIELNGETWDCELAWAQMPYDEEG